MNREEMLKELRRDLDNVLINAKTARRRHDWLSQKYNEGRADGLQVAIDLLKMQEVSL